jgi:hypothetical protein
MSSASLDQRRNRMERSERPEAQRNAGAFMGPDVMIPTPMSTLGDEAAEPRGRQHEQPREGWLARLVRRLRGAKS